MDHQTAFPQLCWFHQIHNLSAHLIFPSQQKDFLKQFFSLPKNFENFAVVTLTVSNLFFGNPYSFWKSIFIGNPSSYLDIHLFIWNPASFLEIRLLLFEIHVWFFGNKCVQFWTCLEHKCGTFNLKKNQEKSFFWLGTFIYVSLFFGRKQMWQKLIWSTNVAVCQKNKWQGKFGFRHFTFDWVLCMGIGWRLWRWKYGWNEDTYFTWKRRWSNIDRSKNQSHRIILHGFELWIPI